MADHIVVVVRITKKKGAVALVGPDGDHWYASFQEHGTPHVPADPFLRPALDSNIDKIIGIFKKEVGNGIEREAKKLAAKQRIKSK